MSVAGPDQPTVSGGISVVHPADRTADGAVHAPPRVLPIRAANRGSRAEPGGTTSKALTRAFVLVRGPHSEWRPRQCPVSGDPGRLSRDIADTTMKGCAHGSRWLRHQRGSRGGSKGRGGLRGSRPGAQLAV